MNVLGLVGIAALLGALEVPALVRGSDYRSLAAVVGLLLLGLGFAIPLATDLPIPTVAATFRWLVGPLLKTQ